MYVYIVANSLYLRLTAYTSIPLSQAVKDESCKQRANHRRFPPHTWHPHSQGHLPISAGTACRAEIIRKILYASQYLFYEKPNSQPSKEKIN